MAPITLSPIVKLDGTALSTTFLDALREIRIERELQVPGRVTLRFVDPGYALADAGTVKLATKVEVTGPDGDPVLISAEVTAIAVEQPPGDQPELVVTALDKSHRLGRTMSVAAYQGTAYSDLVTKLVSSIGLTPDVSSTSISYPYLMQGESDLAWLTEMARRTGSDWWVDGETFHFKEPAQASSPTSLTLGTGLVSFSVKASGYHPQKVTVYGWSSSTQQQITSQVASASGGVPASSKLTGLVKTTTDLGKSEFLHNGLSPASEQEAKQFGQAVFDRAVAASVQAKGVVVPGDGAIGPAGAVSVAGAGPLSGTYPVTAVEHVYRPATGFVTRFRSGDRRSTSLVETLGGQVVAPGLAPAYPAVVIGKVTSTNDPNHAGRVQVTYPGRSGNVNTTWARVLALGGGQKKGVFLIPGVETEVLVSFEEGDPRKPVVLGAVYSDKAAFPTTNTTATIDDGSVNVAMFQSRLGHHVALLDGSDQASQAIELRLNNSSQLIHLGNDALTIEVGSGLPVTIKAGDNASIAFDKQGNVAIKGVKVTIQGTEQVQVTGPQVSASADEQLNLQGQVKAGLSGAQVQVQGEGQVAISGGVVQIN